MIPTDYEWFELREQFIDDLLSQVFEEENSDEE